MTAVRTFTSQIRPFQIHREIEDLDKQVNDFVAAEEVRLISASDGVVTGTSGETIGLIRVVAYEKP